MKDFESIKLAIYFITLGMLLVVYAHSNFATANSVSELTSQSTHYASKEDINRIENKLDKILLFLLENDK